MKKYDNYKDSGIEWIGEIPEHWEAKRIKLFSPVKRGASPRPIDDPKYFDENGEYAWVRIADVTASDRYLTDTTQKLSELGASLSVKRDSGDFFLSIAGSVGKPMITKIKCCIHDGFVYFPKLTINPEFLYYIFQTGLPYLGLGKLGTQLNLNTETVGNIFIPIPSDEEIEKIVNYLDHKTTQIDTLIAKKEQFISLLQEERTSVINQAVTKGLDPTVKMKDSGIEWLGEIPEHWGVKRLKYLCKIINEKTSQKPDYVLALENIKSWTGEIVGNPLENKMEGDVNLFQENDILFNKLRPYLAKVIKTQSNGGCVGELLVLRATHFLTPTFLYFRMISEAIITIVDNSTYGTKMPRASWDKFISLIEIGFPTVDEQNKITDYIENKIREIETLTSKTQQEIELLKEYKTALISEVVTGKVDVRDEVLN